MNCSHGMPAHRYDALFELIASRRLDPARLVGRTVTLEESIDALVKIDEPGVAGITVARPT